MRPLPTNQLDPKVKTVWRLSDSLWVLGLMLPIILMLAVAGTMIDSPVIKPLMILAIIALVVMLVLTLVVLPPIRYARWRYEVTDDFLDIAKGILWRKRYMIPFIRVQNTDTRQGPIMRALGLASVTVSTAARSHEIPGLKTEVAEQLRDRAAELARIAREDV